jgi:hypothetical protein
MDLFRRIHIIIRDAKGVKIDSYPIVYILYILVIRKTDVGYKHQFQMMVLSLEQDCQVVPWMRNLCGYVIPTYSIVPVMVCSKLIK